MDANAIPSEAARFEPTEVTWVALGERLLASEEPARVLGLDLAMVAEGASTAAVRRESNGVGPPPRVLLP